MITFAASFGGFSVLLLVLLVLAAIAGAGRALAGIVGNQRRGNREQRVAVRPAGPLLSAAERSFAAVLEMAKPPGTKVCFKVRLGDVFTPAAGQGCSDRQRIFNQLAQKHVDFLLVEEASFAPVVGVELDDRSHDEAKRIRRDAFVDEVFASSGLRLVRVRAGVSYAPAQLRALLEQARRTGG